MPDSKVTSSPSRFAKALALVIGVLILTAGCGPGGSSAPAAALVPTPVQGIPAQVSPAPRPQVSQLPTPALPGPAVTLPSPGLPTRAVMPPPATIAAPSAEEIARGPRLTIETTEFDFGKVPATGKLEHVFVFTNTGQSDLIIERIITT